MKDKYKLKFLVMPDFVYADSRLNGTQIKIFCFINTYSSEKFYFTNKQLAESFNVSETSISTSIKSLEEYGYIKTTYEVKAGGGQVRFIKNLKDQTRLEEVLKSDFKKTSSKTLSNLKGKDNKIKEIRNIYKENSVSNGLQEWLIEYNKLFGTKYSSSLLSRNYEYWKKYYSDDELKEALSNIPRHDWLKDKHTPALLLRQTDRTGNPVDRFAELLNLKSKTDKEYL